MFCSAAFAGDVAYVTCQSGDALNLIDIGARASQETWSVEGQPAGVAAADHAVFTVSAGSKQIGKFDPVSGERLAAKTLDGGPIGVVLDRSRGRLFVSDWYNARLWVLDVDTLEVLYVLNTGAAPAGVSLSSDGRWLASADKEADQVTIFDADSLAIAHRVAVGIRPFGLRFSADGRLFVGNVGSNDVSVLDPETGETLAIIPVGERPYGVSFAAGKAFVTNQYANTVSVLDVQSYETLQVINVGEYPEGIDTTSDGRLVVLANWFDNTVSIIDANTLSVVDTVETCDGPRAFGRFLAEGQPK